MKSDAPHYHFGDWLRWKRNHVPVGLFYEGSERTYRLLETKSSPGRMSVGVARYLMAALKLDAESVINQWKTESVPPEFRRAKSSVGSRSKLEMASHREK